MSWAVVDYYGIPKPAYFAIKRALEPVVIGVQRKVNEWTVRPADENWHRDTSHIDMRKIWEDVEFDVWIASNRTEKLKGEVVVKFISVKSGKEVIPSFKEAVDINANGTTEVFRSRRVNIPNPQDSNAPFDTSKADPFIIYTTLSIDGGQVISDISWPEPIKYLSFGDRGVSITYSDDKISAVVSTERPVKGFTFSEKQGVKLSDNGFDLVPGEKKKVQITGCKADALEWRYVDM